MRWRGRHARPRLPGDDFAPTSKINCGDRIKTLLNAGCGLRSRADARRAGAPIKPVQFGRWRSAQVLLAFATNQIRTLTRLHAESGPYVILHYPTSRPAKPQILPCIADAELYRSVATNAEAWRSVNIVMRAFKGHAANRLNTSLSRLRGKQHAHYRRMLALPLSKPAVAGMAPDMAGIARRSVEAWPRGEAVDLVPLANELMQDFAITLLFGNDFLRGRPVAHMIGDVIASMQPIPGRAYFRWLRTAPKLEFAINQWAADKRGDLDPKDIFSILVNNRDENGQPPSMEVVAGILIFAFGAGYDTCQNAFAWAMVLLAQHPAIAADLTDEIDQALGGGPPVMSKLASLPLLDQVIKESMRLFPPVPLHFRRSTIETQLGDATIPAGMRVLTSLFLINRDPALYAEPSKFKPERWSSLDPAPFQYPVFGVGARMCPGTLFGLQMLKIAVAAVLSCHRVELAPNARIDYRSTITLTPHPGVPVILRDKTAAPQRQALTGSIRELVDLPATN